MDELNQWIDLLRVIAAGVGGGLISTLAAHRFAIIRERNNGIAARKREFLTFMKSWRVEVCRTLWYWGFQKDAATFMDNKSTYCALSEAI